MMASLLLLGLLLHGNDAHANSWQALKQNYVELQQALDADALQRFLANFNPSVDNFAGASAASDTLSTLMEIVKDGDPLSQTIGPADPGVSSDHPAGRKALPIRLMIHLESVLGQDLDRQADLRDNPTESAMEEREVLEAAAQTVSAALFYLTRAPRDPSNAFYAGLLHAEGAIYAADQLLLRSGAPDSRLRSAVDRLRRGADTVTALRLAGAAAALANGSATPLEHAWIPVLAWTVQEPHISPVWRGEAALLGDDLAAHVWAPSDGLNGPNHGPDKGIPGRAYFLLGALGFSHVCGHHPSPMGEDDVAILGGDSDSAEEAARRLFSWTEAKDADGTHKLAGAIALAPPEEQRQLLCAVALRADIPSAPPAAMALAERAFLVDGAEEPFGIHVDQRLEFAYGMALTALEDALVTRSRLPADAWWVSQFGDLLTPWLVPAWAPSTFNDARRLEQWVQVDATRWLSGAAPTPTWFG